MVNAALLLGAVALDQWLGEPRRYHPLIGFGRWANHLERWLHPGSDAGSERQRWGGIAALLLATVPPVAVALAVTRLPLIGPLFSLLLLYLTIGQRSLLDHARAVAAPLAAGDLSGARQAVAMMVSRDCTTLDEAAVARAGVESVLENGNDATFGALFWFVVGGAPAAVAYRLLNCLDAMWGYRNQRYYYFGWAAARLDDLANWLPARLTVLCYALAGRLLPALHCAWVQGQLAKSPNGGPVMAAGAAALGVRVGGGAYYHGQWLAQPSLGDGRSATVEDIDRACALIQRALLIFIICCSLGLLYQGGI